jgi:hypothetical protein
LVGWKLLMGNAGSCLSTGVFGSESAALMLAGDAGREDEYDGRDDEVTDSAGQSSSSAGGVLGGTGKASKSAGSMVE